jgi:hypothetical protein
VAEFFLLFGIPGDSKVKPGWLDMEFSGMLKAFPDPNSLKTGTLYVTLPTSPATGRLASTKLGTYFLNAFTDEPVVGLSEYRHLVLIESRQAGRNPQGTFLQEFIFDLYVRHPGDIDVGKPVPKQAPKLVPKPSPNVPAPDGIPLKPFPR